jgi:guanine deaminase
MNEYMEIAKKAAENGLTLDEGGPFGAVIVDKSGNIISVESNQVLKNNDPTAHAEIMAIRKACEKLNTYDLSDCILYTSCEPCPMCLSAAIWANIKNIYYACTREDAASIGFRDDFIYEYLNGKNKDAVALHQIDRDKCIDVFKKYRDEKKIIY